MIKLVLSDLDGTLVSDNGTVSEENKNAIRKLKEKGVIFCICTGRIYMSAFLIGEEIGNDYPIVSCNGAYIKDPSSNKVIFSNSFDKEVARKIIKILKKHDLTFHYYDENTVFSNKYERAAKMFGERFKNLKDKPIDVVVSDDIELFLDKAKTIDKFIAFKDKMKNIKECLSELNKLKEIDISQSGDDNIEIMSKNISKGSALKILKDYYGVKSDEVMTIGDQMNDLSMFMESKYSISMENANDILKKKTFYTTKSNNDSGVAYAIDKFVLNKGE